MFYEFAQNGASPAVYYCKKSERAGPTENPPPHTPCGARDWKLTGMLTGVTTDGGPQFGELLPPLGGL
jgi:hypothetical protein